MGCVCLKQRRRQAYENPTVLAAETCFNVAEIKCLHELFRKLSSCIVDDGFISKEEFQLGLFRNSKKQSLFADRMFHLFDTNGNGVIEFGEFVRSLSIFHPNAPHAEKVVYAFRIYDIRDTGFIRRQEVKEMVLALLGESDLTLPNDIIESIVNKTFTEANLKGNGKIDMEEWKGFVAKYPSLLKNMTIPYLKDITTAFPSFVQRPSTEDEKEYT